MYILWQLVLIAVVSAGSSIGRDPESIEDLNKEEAGQRTFLSSLDIISEAKFQCHNKPSGYYADPRYDCKVFHYCHEDGTKVTIPCGSDIKEHKICIFKDIAFNACEGSEIYLALPEDLHVKAPKETTSSAINSATDFKLSNVLPFPSSPESNHSTTPLSLNFEQTEKRNSLVNSKDVGSIFEVFNSVLREIQAENSNKLQIRSKKFKVSPSTFSRGSKIQASSIKTDDSSDALKSKNRAENRGTYLVEVYHKDDEKLSSGNDPYYKRSKRLFFLPKLEKKTPGTHPRRKKRTVAETLNVSRPYAVIYAKVSEGTRGSSSKIGKKASNQRRDILEVPFAPARVPADVPTVPIAIETRRKKKSKSKKKGKNNSQAVYVQQTFPRGRGQEQTSEQQNVLFFASEQVPSISLESFRDRGVHKNRQRPQQNAEQPQQIETKFSNIAETQESLQPSYETLMNREVNPLQIPHFPFQPTSFLTNSGPPQFYLTSEDFQQPGNLPTFNLQDQFVLQPEQPQILHSNSFRQPNAAHSQSVKHQENTQPQSKQPENNIPQSVRQSQSSQSQSLGKPENFPSQSHKHVTPQMIRKPQNDPQTVRHTENTLQSIRHTERIPPQTFRKPEPQPFSQPEILPQAFNRPENTIQSFRQPENIHQTFQQPQNIRPQVLRQPENILTETFRLPENIQSQTNGQSDAIPTQTFRKPENIQPQTARRPESIQPHSIRQPEVIQPQTIRQLQNIYFQNVPPFSFTQPETTVQTVRQPQSDEHQPLQNTNTQNVPVNDRDRKNDRDRRLRPQQNSPSQRFPGFDSSFFQEFPNFGSLTFNSPFSQTRPHSYDLYSPPAVHFQEQLNHPQHTDNAGRTPQQAPQQLENPHNQAIPHPVLSERPQNSLQQEYGNHVRQLTPEGHQYSVNQPGANVIYQQPKQNPNLVEAERAKQERTKTTSENVVPQSLLHVPESARPSRNRGRPTPATEVPIRQSVRQRNRDQSSQDAHRQNPRRPQENTRLRGRPHQESQQPSNFHIQPNELPRPTSEIVYHPHQPEISVGETPNELHQRLPSTAIVPNFRLQESSRPQNIRDDQRETAYRQSQPPRQRNRQYNYDNSNGQSQPHYPTVQYTPTTPVPSPPPRQRTRQQGQYPSRETYQQNPRQINKESAGIDADKPSYDYRVAPSPDEKSRKRPSSQRQQSPEILPVTNRYFVTSAPRFRHSEETENRRPQLYPESQHERPRGRPQAQIERPPSKYVNAEPLKEEYPRPQRYYSQRPQNTNVENDVNIISTAEYPNSQHQTTPSGAERRPGYRGTSNSRQRTTNPEVEHGFLPVSERPLRQYAYSTRAPEKEYSYTTRPSEREHSRTPDREYSREPDREYSRAPDREYSRAPDREYPHASRAPEREYSYATRSPLREYTYSTRAPLREYSQSTRAPSREYSYSTRTLDREYSHATRAPEKEYAYSTRAPEREYSYTTKAPEREYSYATRAVNREYSYATRTPEREYSYSTRAPEREYSYPTRTPGREYSYSTRTPEREYSYSTRAPEREHSHSSRVPEREYREPVNERTRGNRHQNYNEESPTTRLVTTPRPTKKQKPPPPRPTFPPFPTFPPPPRFVTSPRPKSTESPESEKELPEATEYITEYSTTTQQTIRRQRPKTEIVTEISEPRYVTENYIQTDAPEVTTRRRTRKRRPRPRRPKTTTSYSDDPEDAIQVETITQATTHKEVTTRSTPSNFNRWRQQTMPQRKTSSTTPSTTTSSSNDVAKTEEYGSRINLFGRPRTRKPAAFAPRSPTTTTTPSFSHERKKVVKTPTATRTRKPFAKKVRKRPTTTETPETTDPIDRSDENEDILHFHSDVNFQELESVTQLSVENMEDFRTTEAYNDAVETTTETYTISYQEDLNNDTKDKSEDFESTRSVLQKFQNRPRILKFGKPRLRPTDSPLDFKAAESKNLR